MNGYIEFSVSGGNDARSCFGTATMDAAKNENAVVVTKAQAVEFLALRDVIEEAIAGGPPATSYIAPSTRTCAPPQSGGALGAAEGSAHRDFGS